MIDMRDSSTYMHTLKEGAIEALQKMLLRLGRKRFGAANKTIKTTIEGIFDLPRLERMTDRMLSASNWQELLDTL